MWPIRLALKSSVAERVSVVVRCVVAGEQRCVVAATRIENERGCAVWLIEMSRDAGSSVVLWRNIPEEIM
jgi:hypothetical protein